MFWWNEYLPKSTVTPAFWCDAEVCKTCASGGGSQKSLDKNLHYNSSPPNPDTQFLCSQSCQRHQKCRYNIKWKQLSHTIINTKITTILKIAMTFFRSCIFRNLLFLAVYAIASLSKWRQFNCPSVTHTGHISQTHISAC